MLETRDAVHVTELSKAFAVSEVTVRSDLSQLARQGLVARVRGGVRPLERGQSELGFDFRLRLEVERKQAIARAAAAMVDEARRSRSTRARPPTTSRSSCGPRRSSSSSTTAWPSPRRPPTRRLGSRCWSPAGCSGCTRCRSWATSGPTRCARRRISKGFLGARGPEHRARPDGPQPRRGAHQARDRERLRARDLHRRRHQVAPDRAPAVRRRPSSCTRIVTDTSAPAAEVEAWRARGVEIVLRRARRRRAGLPKPLACARFLMSDERRPSWR